jgi:uncharacterized protein
LGSFFAFLLMALMLMTACNAADTPQPATAQPQIAITIFAPTATPIPAYTPEPVAQAPQTSVSDVSAAAAPAVAAPAITTASVPTLPLTIEAMRQRSYPGSDIVIEQTLAPGSNYNRYYVSYQSDGLKIFALLTVPRTQKPATGFPVVVFNHGFIPPDVYKTTERYVAYVDAFARNGYIVLRSDYRGHDQSEGEARGGYGSPDYTVDVLNGLASVKRYKDADPNRVGMWGHSMGGHITLRSMVVNKEIKAGVIWAGVVASYGDMLNNWRRPNAATNPPIDVTPSPGRRWRREFVEQYGSPESNPTFWNSISPITFIGDVAPIQIHHGSNDADVPIAFSDSLAASLKAANRNYEYFIYKGDNHNLSGNLGLALRRSVAFFDKYVKGSP